MISKCALMAIAVAAIMVPVSASAEGLLGGLLGGGSDAGGSSSSSSVLGVVGGADSGALVTVGSNAGTSGAVNLGLGGSDGVVSANVGRDPVVNASVLGPKGIADVNANLGDVGLGVNVGGPKLVDIDVRLPRGGNGGNGGNGENGGNGNGGNGANGGNGSGGFFIFGGGGSNSRAGGLNAGLACDGTSASQLVSLFQKSTTRGWDRASGIQLVPIKVCADLRKQMANWLASNGEYHNLVGRVSQDALINAALSRTKYQPGHVLGVQRQGSTLMVYVF